MRTIEQQQINERLMTARHVCRLDGCGGTHYAKGYCGKHWAKWRKYGDPLAGRDMSLRDWKQQIIAPGVTRCPDDPDVQPMV